MAKLDPVFANFLKYSKHIVIISKDKGFLHLSKGNWYGSQKYLIYKMWEAVKENDECRTFVILKGRQMGITTILLGLDLFYAYTVRGARLAIMMNDYINANLARKAIISDYHMNIPPKQRKADLATNTRDFTRFDNFSEIHYLYTSDRSNKKGTVGRSRGFNYIHASEVAYFKNMEDLFAVRASLSNSHPYRMFIYESTANGYNDFYDMWETAKKSPVQKAIFLGWWLKEDYRVDPNKEPTAYKFYSYSPSSEEAAWIRQVKKLYGVEISMAQLAWWRKQLAEQYMNDENFCLQEFPFTEYQAFQLSGMRFFNTNIINTQLDHVKEAKPERYRIYYSRDFIIEKDSSAANLTIFEKPEQGGTYVVGVDPTMGANMDSDNAVIQVFRCYKDRIEQVAEFADNQVDPQALARYVLLLASIYNSAMVILEVTGVGHSTLAEIDKLKREGWVPEVKNLPEELREVFNTNIRKSREYLYSRQDALRKSFVRHWKTTAETKVSLLGAFRGALTEGKIILRSKELVEEMTRVVKDGSVIEAQSGWHDDRVIAAALCWECYDKFLRRIAPDRYEEEEETKLNKKATNIIKIGDLTLKLTA